MRGRWYTAYRYVPSVQKLGALKARRPKCALCMCGMWSEGCTGPVRLMQVQAALCLGQWAGRVHAQVEVG